MLYTCTELNCLNVLCFTPLPESSLSLCQSSDAASVWVSVQKLQCMENCCSGLSHCFTTRALDLGGLEMYFKKQEGEGRGSGRVSGHMIRLEDLHGERAGVEKSVLCQRAIKPLVFVTIINSSPY